MEELRERLSIYVHQVKRTNDGRATTAPPLTTMLFVPCFPKCRFYFHLTYFFDFPSPAKMNFMVHQNSTNNIKSSTEDGCRSIEKSSKLTNDATVIGKKKKKQLSSDLKGYVLLCFVLLSLLYRCVCVVYTLLTLPHPRLDSTTRYLKCELICKQRKSF